MNIDLAERVRRYGSPTAEDYWLTHLDKLRSAGLPPTLQCRHAFLEQAHAQRTPGSNPSPS